MTTQTAARYPQYGSPRTNGFDPSWRLVGLSDDCTEATELGIQWSHDFGLYCLTCGALTRRVGPWTRNEAIQHHETVHAA